MSALFLVLLILALGSLLIQGLNLQHQNLLSQTRLETTAIRASANAESLLQWGKSVSWQVSDQPQCRESRDYPGRVCLRHWPDGTALMIAVSGEQTRWQSGRKSASGVTFDSNGWSDFCPRKDTEQCLLP